jgi:hypothetical protein
MSQPEIDLGNKLLCQIRLNEKEKNPRLCVIFLHRKTDNISDGGEKKKNYK